MDSLEYRHLQRYNLELYHNILSYNCMLIIEMLLKYPKRIKALRKILYRKEDSGVPLKVSRT